MGMRGKGLFRPAVPPLTGPVTIRSNSNVNIDSGPITSGTFSVNQSDSNTTSVAINNTANLTASTSVVGNVFVKVTGNAVATSTSSSSGSSSSSVSFGGLPP
jgi:phage gp45-like